MATVAVQRVTRGSVVVVVDVPKNVDFGLDCVTYVTGPKFRGMCQVPPGLHLLYLGTQLGQREGVFFLLEDGSAAAGGGDRWEEQCIYVREWDTALEELRGTPEEEACDVRQGAYGQQRGGRMSAEAAARLCEEVRTGQLDASLGPYPREKGLVNKWRNLSNCVTRDTLRRAGLDFHVKVRPGEGEQGVAEEAMMNEARVAAQQGEGQDDGKAVPVEVDNGTPPRSSPKPAATTPSPPASVQAPGRIPQFVDVRGRQRRRRADADVPSEVTSWNLDRSAWLGELVRDQYGGRWAELLGELQLSFICFFALYCHTGLTHWKDAVRLLCSCRSALRTQPELFSAFMRVLHTQLGFIPEDFFEEEISAQNFLGPALGDLFHNLELEEEQSCQPDQPAAVGLDETLVECGQRLRTYVRNRFGLFEEEAEDAGALAGHDRFITDDEDMPIMVSASEVEAILARAAARAEEEEAGAQL